ncbi:MAG: molecular chaperone HtpG [Bacteroidales bacterium]|jgi:molecular chaperone HtpG|nr:molecular chaperone HtpG [Bacteroidales bacterium]
MAKTKGKIGVTSENIFPIIKKFLYSEHDIFLRELVSNAVDATQKLKTLAIAGDFKGELKDPRIFISVNKKKRTITISDHGIGMTADEVKRYINQIAFSSAGDFLEKYKNDANAIIGHFGLGFYSAFMVSEKVEVITKSYQEDAEAVRWECEGSPQYKMETTEKENYGTDVILHLDKDSDSFLEKTKITELLNKYCKFLPIPIVFGKKTEWKDGKEQETEEDNVINNTEPAWVKKPADLKEEDYNEFYRELYPMNFDEPLFNIHLNVDFPFNLTGILYFPKIKSNIDIQRNKIQLYCNQVYVTDSVEGIVPEFLTLLHGVIDSPDIPLNVSRSYLQGDPNVKKISAHITKKVADRLNDLFKENRENFEKKWDDLKMFIEYGMITEEKFYEKAEKFFLFKNTDGKYFTIEEYKKLVETEQTDKDKQLIYLYASDVDSQYSYIKAAKEKAYDVLLFDGQLDMHFINHIESKFENQRFLRVDSDIIDNLIRKDEKIDAKLGEVEQQHVRIIFEGVLPEDSRYIASTANMRPEDMPVLITNDEFMRRMKDMSKMGTGTNFYRDMPDSLRLVVNTNHPIVIKISEESETKLAAKLNKLEEEAVPLRAERDELNEKLKDKKDEEISQEDKDKRDNINKKIREISDKKSVILKESGKKNKLVNQLFDLALLSNNMLKGESLNSFVKRSLDLLEK